jgi:ankyrin repeat protein
LSQKYLEDKDIITRLNFQRWEETHDIQIWEKYFTIFRHPDFKEENTPTQIDEKFSEESDPVADLSIGLYKFWQEKYAEIGKTQPRYTYEKYFDDNYQYNSGNSLCVYLLWDTLLYLGQKINPQEAFNKASVGRNNLHKRKVARTLKKHFYVNVKVENVNEKFKEESDPISDLGIGMREQITKFMIDHAEQYNNKEDMLRVSCIFGKPEFIKFLIADGANIHINKDAPLREAAHIGCIECMQLLLDAGANIDAFNGAALTWAVQNEQYEVVEFLLANGADININDGKAIREACATYDVKMAKILFDHGADVHAWKNWILKTVWGNNSQMDKHIDAQLAKEKIKNK